MPLTPQITAFFADSQGHSSDGLLAAFAAYLAIAGGSSSFDIGFRSAELEQDLTGLQPFFAAATPLRVEHRQGWNFGQLQRALAEQLTLVRRHVTYLADLPARYEELRAEPALGARSLPIAVAQVERLDRSSAVSGSELTLLIAPDGGACDWLYDPRLLDAADVKRMADQWGRLLAAIVTDPDRPLEQLPLISAAERHRLLVTWNDTSGPYPADQCLHQLFEAQAEGSPEATALLAGGSEMSYGELNRRANQLAHHLRTLGVGPDRLVAVCLQRSPELIVSLLAILKAGGAYLPLDPSYPRERLAFMLADAQAPILIAGQDWEQNDLAPDTLLLRLAAEWPAVARQSAENPAVAGHPDNLAYVIYTSGSTGRPKGAMIPHRGLVNYLSWCLAAYPLAEGRGAPLHTSIAFDLTVTSLWAPLLAGRSLLLLPEEQWNDSLAAALIHEGGWSLLKLTPAHLELLREQLQPGEAAGRTHSLVIGGEALYGETLAFWRQHAPDTRLFNEYGPTETVVGCCVYELPAGSTASGPVPIGRPIGNTQLYLLDRLLQPVPVGLPGELYIGGVGVCRGYLNRPELTAERFIPDPFAATPGARLYRSGDMARYRPDGTIEYLGRTDQQVKIRGFRVELGEVAAALLEHPAVADAVVLAEAAAQRLTAYVVPAASQQNTIETTRSPDPYRATLPTMLRRFLKDRLPVYMLPAAYVLLEELPLTPNGKVDRRALPPPDAAAQAEQGGYEAPHNGHEQQLTQLWSTLLGVSQVGIHDNFFELGGHSLLATRLVSQLRNTFGVELSLRSLFETPTVAALAERLAALEWATSQGPAPVGSDREEGEL